MVYLNKRKKEKQMSAEESITAVIFMTCKAEREDEIRKLATSLTESTRAQDEGCINYVFHQRVDNPREFVMYERWRDLAALQAHLARLQEVYGPPSPGQQGLPAAILEPFEKFEGIGLRVIE
jgi:quinol monooxygenase YgiN